MRILRFAPSLILVLVLSGTLISACGGGPEVGVTEEAATEAATPVPIQVQITPTSTPVPPPPTPIPLPTATPEEGQEEPSPAVTDVMIQIPAGPFIMGSNSGNPGHTPAHEVDLPAYEIDRFEVTLGDFAMFAETTGYETDAEKMGVKSWRDELVEGRENHPAVRVTWNDAVAYCEWLGKRLPTEAEWEKAARGDKENIFPWGNEWDPKKANVKETGLRGTAAVGSFGEGGSPYGVDDMTGNVWEWTADWYQPYPGNTAEDKDYGEVCRVTRGGGWFDEEIQSTTFYRNCADPDATAIDELGFRCARSE